MSEDGRARIRCAEAADAAVIARICARAFYERHGFTVLDTNDGDRNMESLPDMTRRWAPHSAR
ncbi:hypothetical protein [Streptomyces sp. MspMP-M5]|uniref:hypothetical protein n=1 Tax=Streptomyces sp. MspMP-M5 TaxID=1155718 RepID=UPI003B637741